MTISNKYTFEIGEKFVYGGVEALESLERVVPIAFELGQAHGMELDVSVEIFSVGPLVFCLPDYAHGTVPGKRDLM